MENGQERKIKDLETQVEELKKEVYNLDRIIEMLENKFDITVNRNQRADI